MLEEVNQVVGIAFIKNGKLLISKSVRSSKQNIFTLVGGDVNEGETNLQAAVREVKEEVQNNFTIEESDLEEIFSFLEPAASDASKLIQIHVMLAKKEIDVELKPNNEILEYRWFSLGEDESILSSSIRNFFIPYAISKGLMY